MRTSATWRRKAGLAGKIKHIAPTATNTRQKTLTGGLAKSLPEIVEHVFVTE